MQEGRLKTYIEERCKGETERRWMECESPSALFYHLLEPEGEPAIVPERE